jgi:hypothetical protein
MAAMARGSSSGFWAGARLAVLVLTRAIKSFQEWWSENHAGSAGGVQRKKKAVFA